MKIAYTSKEYSSAGWDDLLPLYCEHCEKIFYIIKTRINSELYCRKGHNRYCSNHCAGLAKRNRITTVCRQCNIVFETYPYRLLKTALPFCSYSCSASYNVARRTNFSYVSKLEKWIATELTTRYPLTEFHFNRRDKILMELDIFIPVLNIAFEINGPSHYKPIYGSENLSRVIWNDNRRKNLCSQTGIALYIINTSDHPSFNIKTTQPYLDTIISIIDTVREK